MVFGIGRKKKQEPENVADETANQENDLAVSYGNGGELNDEASVTDSIPPPPPEGKKDAEESTQEESPSVGADDVAGESADAKKEEELIKRKKMLLIASCIISFIILLGLAIKYGQVRKNQSLANTSVELENESLIESEIESSSTSWPVSATVAPTILATDATDDATEVVPFADCVANEISAETTCVNVQGATAALNFCLVDEVTDQFWAWVSTPPRTAPVLANEWGWMRFGEEAELPFLPEGSYEIGLFSNGDEDLAEYPLITSYQFDVNCRE